MKLGCLRRKARIKWHEKIRDREVPERCQISGIEAFLMTAQLHWTVHVTQMDNWWLPKMIFYVQLQGDYEVGNISVAKMHLRRTSLSLTSTQLTSSRHLQRVWGESHNSQAKPMQYRLDQHSHLSDPVSCLYLWLKDWTLFTQMNGDLLGWELSPPVKFCCDFRLLFNFPLRWDCVYNDKNTVIMQNIARASFQASCYLSTLADLFVVLIILHHV